MISVIVPVYNAEKYLARCVDSVLAQSFDDFELILVDDGSNDGSGAICDKYATRDSRVKVLHKKNGGVSAARESGIAQARGEYIAFIDADDYIAEDYLKVLYQDIVKYNADISCCDCLEIVNGVETNRFHNVSENRIIKNKAEYIQDYINHKEFYGYVVWAKLIRKELVSGQSFKRIRFGEDTVYMLNLFEKVKITVLNEYKGYYYIRNEDSVTIKGVNDITKQLNHLYIGEALVHLSSFTDKCIQEIAANQYANSIYAVLSFLIKGNDKENFEENYDYLCQHINAVLKLRGLKIKYRVMLRFYKLFPKLYWSALHPVLREK